MRPVPDTLRAHLAGDATTLCHAWRVTRRDGVVLGFTDHDHDLAFADTTFQAASGYRASDWEGAAGLAASSADVAGALSSESISDADIAAGRYDGASVELYLVNWASPADHLRLKVLEIGEITRTSGHFRAELRSQAHRLSQMQGRIYSHRCDATFGDARCGKNADHEDYRAEGAVLTVDGVSRITVDGLDVFASGFFRYGLLRFTSGVNAGQAFDIENHVRAHGQVSLVFWLPLPLAPASGDTFIVTAGCDKSFATCKEKFANALNFRGFPHMPGADFAYSYADGETEHDGGVLYE